MRCLFLWVLILVGIQMNGQVYYWDDTPPLVNVKGFFDLEGVMVGYSGGFAYSGFTYGPTLKYSKPYAFGTMVYHAEYSRIVTGICDCGEEVGVGLRLAGAIPVGLSLSTFRLFDQYSVNIRPEVGFDFGLFTLMYGYNVGIYDQVKLSANSRHYLKVGLGINISKPFFDRK